MELTFVNDFGQSFVVEIDPNMELENVMALLEAEASRKLSLCALIVAMYSCHDFAMHSQIFQLVNRASLSRAGSCRIRKRRCRNSVL